MWASPGRSPRTGSSVSATSLVVIMTDAPESASTCRSSRAVYPGLTGTATSPARRVPKNASAKAGTWGSAMATRPGVPPAAGSASLSSDAATASTRASSSAHVRLRGRAPRRRSPGRLRQHSGTRPAARYRRHCRAHLSVTRPTSAPGERQRDPREEGSNGTQPTSAPGERQRDPREEGSNGTQPTSAPGERQRDPRNVSMIALGDRHVAHRVRLAWPELQETSRLADVSLTPMKMSPFMLSWSTHPFLGLLKPLTPRRPLCRVFDLLMSSCPAAPETATCQRRPERQPVPQARPTQP